MDAGKKSALLALHMMLYGKLGLNGSRLFASGVWMCTRERHRAPVRLGNANPSRLATRLRTAVLR